MTANPADAMPFSKLMGVSITQASADAVHGELVVREDLCTLGGIVHGGAVMAFADALGAAGAFIALPNGAVGTTTIESKSNFLGAAKCGQTLIGVAKPEKIGSRISVWRTDITTQEGAPVALVIQTQLVLS